MHPTTRPGFALIEFLIVVAIIGILAAIAIPRFASSKEKTYLAAMKTDLRNLAGAQRAFLAARQQYANVSASNAGGAVVQDQATGFVPSAGVTIAATANGGTGWRATASHRGTPKKCFIFVGDQGPYGLATTAGEPRCDP
jgi:prepilin-type N-terminal cleavage/methylation domain-containing protein